MVILYQNPSLDRDPSLENNPGLDVRRTNSKASPGGRDGAAEADTRAPRKTPPAVAVISVNDVAITEAMIATEAQHHPAGDPGEALAAAARALVVRELLLQEAGKLGVASDPAADVSGRRDTPEDIAIHALIDREVIVPVASETECRRYYQNNLKRFWSAPVYEARHILLAASAGDRKVRAEMKAEAERLIAHLQERPSDFSSLAHAYSACPSKQQDGNLGQITKGSTVREFESALEGMPAGTLSATPVETRYGFHVVFLDRKIDGRQLPFDVVKERISAWLEAASWSRAVSQYVAIVAGKADIQGIDLEAAVEQSIQ